MQQVVLVLEFLFPLVSSLKVGQSLAGVLHSNVYVKMCDSRMEDRGPVILRIRLSNSTSLVVKFRPITSLTTLKKHSTSSVLLVRGCSIGRLALKLSRLCHSLPSILVINADKVSFENPSTSFKLLDVTNNTNRHEYTVSK